MVATSKKARLRSKYKGLRQAMDNNEAAAASQKIAHTAMSLIDFPKPVSLHSYLPIKAQKEVDTLGILRYVWANYPSVKTYVPLAGGKVGSTLLVPGLENNNSVSLGDITVPDSHKFDLILVPLLAFDTDGYRLGYGSGYYDRLLSAQPHALKIGLGYSFCQTSKLLPREPHDVPLDIIITEQGVLDFGAGLRGRTSR